ncbi:putative phosphodiesterase I [Lupinus albus]|uniref:Putative phosphodiesterase I n=1 Tax=Lupinus albus TaxID=3870 RepID=A0A6A4PV83_LUPAL|nr:putative phosphodiesterase I [Lupinus albus]
MMKQQTEMGDSKFVFLAYLLLCSVLQMVWSHGVQPLSRVALHKAKFSLLDLAHIQASPSLLGIQVSFNTVVQFKFIFLCSLGGQTAEWVTLEYSSPSPSNIMHR